MPAKKLDGGAGGYSGGGGGGGTVPIKPPVYPNPPTMGNPATPVRGPMPAPPSGSTGQPPSGIVSRPWPYRPPTTPIDRGGNTGRQFGAPGPRTPGGNTMDRPVKDYQ
jgi:hypothetical protein